MIQYALALTLAGAVLAAISTPALAEHIERAEPTVSIAFVGDVMLAGTPGKGVSKGVDPFVPFAAVLDKADIRVANLECVVAVGGSAEAHKPYTFRAHPRTLRLIKQHFDALSLANNHTGDYGPSAFAEMLGRLRAHGIRYFGGGHDLESAHAPLVIERSGLRIALLGYNEFFPRSFEADADKPGVAWSEDEQVWLDIVNARARLGADVVIPFMHWGWEYERRPSPRQRRLARLMIDAGADAVVGAHPHVIQDVELYRGRPIAYSLGNFVFDGFADAASNTGLLLRLELDRTGVRHWETVVARIDRHGIPHPVEGQDHPPPFERIVRRPQGSHADRAALGMGSETPDPLEGNQP